MGKSVNSFILSVIVCVRIRSLNVLCTTRAESLYGTYVRLKALYMKKIQLCTTRAESLYGTYVRLRALYMKNYDSTQPNLIMHYIARSIPHSSSHACMDVCVPYNVMLVRR